MRRLETRSLPGPGRCHMGLAHLLANTLTILLKPVGPPPPRPGAITPLACSLYRHSIVVDTVRHLERRSLTTLGAEPPETLEPPLASLRNFHLPCLRELFSWSRPTVGGVTRKPGRSLAGFFFQTLKMLPVTWLLGPALGGGALHHYVILAGLCSPPGAHWLWS